MPSVARRLVILGDLLKAHNWLGGALPPPKNHLVGLTIANNAVDGEHYIDVNAGEAASDDTNRALMVLASAITKGLDASFAEGDGNGGMVSGESLPIDGTVHLWLIAKADGTIDVCANEHGASGLDPALPSGFVRKRYLWSLVTDGSANIRLGLMVGSYWWYSSISGDWWGTFTTSRVLESLPIPAGGKHIAEVFSAHNDAGGSDSHILTDPDGFDITPGETIATVSGTTGDTNSRWFGARSRVSTDTSGRVGHRATDPMSGAIHVFGWENTLRGAI